MDKDAISNLSVGHTKKDVLDLPIEEQKRLAESSGMSFENWVEYQKQLTEEIDNWEILLASKRGKRPEGWTAEDEKRAKRFQTIVDSEVPGWMDEQRALAAQNGKTLEEWLEDMRKELE